MSAPKPVGGMQASVPDTWPILGLGGVRGNGTSELCSQRGVASPGRTADALSRWGRACRPLARAGRSPLNPCDDRKILRHARMAASARLGMVESPGAKSPGRRVSLLPAGHPACPQAQVPSCSSSQLALPCPDLPAGKSFFCGGYAGAGAVGAMPFGSPPTPLLNPTRTQAMPVQQRSSSILGKPPTEAALGSGEAEAGGHGLSMLCCHTGNMQPIKKGRAAWAGFLPWAKWDLQGCCGAAGA